MVIDVRCTCTVASGGALVRSISSPLCPLHPLTAAEAVERERARLTEAVEAMPGTAWNGTTEGGKRLDWLVERAAVLALLIPDSTGAREP